MIIHFDDTELEVLVDDNSYRRRAVKEKDKLVLYYSPGLIYGNGHLFGHIGSHRFP